MTQAGDAVDIARSTHDNRVITLRGSVSLSSLGSAYSIFKLPAHAVVLDAVARIDTVFNAGTLNTIEVGISGDADKFIDISAAETTVAGSYDMGFGTARLTGKGYETTQEETVTVTYTQSGSAATTGALTVTMSYMVENGNNNRDNT